MVDEGLEGRSLLHQTERLQTLNEISRVVSSTLDLRTLYDTIYQQIERVMDTTLFFIALLNQNGRLIELPYLREDGELETDTTFPVGNSVTSLVIERGTPLLFHTDADYVEYARANGLPSVMIGDNDKAESVSQIYVALNTGSRTIGALSVQSRREHVYSEDDVQTLLVIASQAAVAIVNAGLYAQSQKSVREMQALLHVAQTINGSLDLQTVLDSILSSVRDVIPYHIAGILLADQATGYLDPVGVIGPVAIEQYKATKVPFGRGVTGRVYESGQPLVVGDVEHFDDYIGGGVIGVHSELAVPLRRGDTVVGVLNVERQEIDAFSEDDLTVLVLFASQAAIAIENARLYSEQKQRVDELQTIQHIVQKLTPLHDITAIAELIDRELRSLIDYHACRLFFLEPGTNILVPVDFEGTDVRDYSVTLGQGITGWIGLHGQPVIVPNTLAEPRVSHIPGTPVQAESMLGVPLLFEDRVRGVLTLSKYGTNQFDANSRRLLEIIAAQAAIAVDRARLYDELRTEAVTDELTRLYNRRYLLERYREETSRSIRNRHTLFAIMLDIDKFKLVNDTYGHDAGDVVLRELAGVSRAVVRAEDIVARYGGEEFCILLPEIPPQDAALVADRLRQLVAAHRMPERAGVRRITVSVGMSQLEPDDAGTDLFTRADQAMYEVKRAGGNRLCVSRDGGFAFYEPGGYASAVSKQASGV